MESLLKALGSTIDPVFQPQELSHDHTAHEGHDHDDGITRLESHAHPDGRDRQPVRDEDGVAGVFLEELAGQHADHAANDNCDGIDRGTQRESEYKMRCRSRRSGDQRRNNCRENTHEPMMFLDLEPHDLIHREICLSVAEFLDGSNNGTLCVRRQRAECVRVGELDAGHGNGYRPDVVVVHQFIGQNTSLVLSWHEQGLTKIDGLGLLALVVTLVVLGFLVLDIRGIISALAAAGPALSMLVSFLAVTAFAPAVVVVPTTAFAPAVVVVPTTGALFAVLFHLVSPRMKPRDTNGGTVDVTLHDDVRLILVKVVVPLLENLFALLNAFDIVDSHLDQHGKPPMR